MSLPISLIAATEELISALRPHAFRRERFRVADFSL